MNKYSHMDSLVGEWTVERLDSLPEHTVIEWDEYGKRMRAIRVRYLWEVAGETTVYYSEGVMEDAAPHSIQVVSAPIDTILGDEAERETELRESIASEIEALPNLSIRHFGTRSLPDLIRKDTAARIVRGNQPKETA